MVKGKAAAANVRVPQTKEEAAEMIAEYGAAIREIAVIELAMLESLAKVKKQAELDAKKHGENAKQLFKGLQIYCEANRQALLGNSGLKTANLGTGKVSWRHKPAKVTPTDEIDELVKRIIDKATAALNRDDPVTALSYKAFIRTTSTIDKEAMLKNADLARTIEGVRIGSGGEQFEIEPFGADAEISEAAE
ncbi:MULTISPECIES: host-nuclease inhibitor Gam family protein [unclassified Bradyrhizobium]|uniref:host-nuclease inhibitor Gam family protein n=1 Tax=unclassified Bradyrhizobium TaxID=2631580 RepID=UPI0028E66907|nr:MULTISPECIES: host-nuclease inhibitor Gam family protein [unclassified Bradyrhizobium]